MTDGSGATSWTYDAFGRTATETQGHVKRVLRFSYDGDSERTGLEIVPTTGGTPWETSYGYDNAGRLHSVLDGRISSGQPYVYAYAPNASLVAQVTTPTGQKVIKTYDPLARLLNTTGQQANGTVFSSFTYSYNVAGQRQNETALDHSRDFTYDAQYQLLQATTTVGGMETTRHSYTYDSIGNRITAATGVGGGSITTYAHNTLTNTLP